jgi:Calcineurin-like phosphoesterase
MSVLVSGDLHFSDNPRDAYRHEWVGWFLAQAKKHKADGIVLLGDLTEGKDHHSGWLTNKVVGHLAAMAKLCPVIVLQGNHDFLGSPQDAFFGFTHRLDGVAWVSMPIAGGDLPAAFSMGLGPALFLPWTGNYKRDWAQLDLSFGYAPIFCHQTFDGADVGFGRKLEGVPVGIFPKDAMVIAGDIHVPQKLGPVTYCGSPYRCDFGDDFEGRILKLDGPKLTSIAYDGPQKLLFEITDPDELRKLDVTEGDIVKVNVHVADKERWAETKDAVMRWGEKRKVWVYSVVPVMAKAKQRVRGKVEARSDDELLGAFCKQRGLSESVVKTGRFLMEKA